MFYTSSNKMCERREGLLWVDCPQQRAINRIACNVEKLLAMEWWCLLLVTFQELYPNANNGDKQQVMDHKIMGHGVCLWNFSFISHSNEHQTHSQSIFGPSKQQRSPLVHVYMNLRNVSFVIVEWVKLWIILLLLLLLCAHTSVELCACYARNVNA